VAPPPAWHPQYGGAVELRIQHVGLVVSDLDRSRRFYAEALGLEEVPRPPNFTFDGAWFRFGGTEIHLLAETHATGGAGHADPGAGAARGMTTHLALETQDLAVACNRLAENGVELVGGPMPRGDGYVQVFFRDPDGYVLELFQHTGEDQSNAPARTPVR
jgi:catechol 2,3-dioxygenase-like lactoylglutathione lyase family enzyme